MAKGYVKVDASNLKEMLLRFEQVTGKSMPQIVRSHARICAVELANRTQPFSVGSGAGPAVIARGTMYLRKDILKAVKDKGKLDEKAQQIQDEKLRTRLQAMIASGNEAGIAALLKACGVIKTVQNFHSVRGNSDIGDIHKSNRSKRTGHTLSTRGEYYFAKTGFDGYVKTVAKRLGYAKSGWAEAARKIGGVKGDGARGIPAFAKRQKGNNGEAKDNTERKDSPHFTMTNTTPWVSRLLPPRKQTDATNVARDKMIKAMNKVFAYVAKNGKDVESITAAVAANAE